MAVTSGNVNKVPPDGGYGWVVMFAHALNMMVTLPLFFSFGLVFKEAMSDVGLSHSQGSLVLVLNGSVGMFMSFLGGPVMRRFGYRKVAATGAILTSLGLFITAVVSNFWMFILSYSIMNSLGVNAVMAGSSIAINSFFKEKRARAIGIAVSLMGLGPIAWPQVLSGLLSAFGWRYTVLTLSAISLHTLVAACLLRPVKWYLKYPTHSEELMPLNKRTNVDLISSKDVSSTKENGFQSEDNAVLTSKTASIIPPVNAAILPDGNAASHHGEDEGQYKRWESQEINLGSSTNIFFNEQNKKVSDAKDKVSVNKEQPKSFFTKIVDMFDLTLLNDPIFVNILFGMAMAACAENIFFLLLPIMLHDMMQFETEQIATLMSIIGVTDTIFRFVTPFIGEWCQQPPRVMYSGGLLLFVLINTIMLFTSSFKGMVFLSLVIGLSKGYRLIYISIITPSYVPIERLPFAFGIQMFIIGIFGFCIGPIIGRVREFSGAYHLPIVVMNVITMLTVISWSAEFIYCRIKNKKI